MLSATMLSIKQYPVIEPCCFILYNFGVTSQLFFFYMNTRLMILISKKTTKTKAFESQLSSGRLEIKPNMNLQQKGKTYIK